MSLFLLFLWMGGGTSSFSSGQEQLPSLLSLLEERGVDYGRPNLDRDVQLPLEAFEDTTMWTRTPGEWQLLMRDSTGQATPLACTALRTMEDGSGRWQTASVLGWDAASQRYNVKWANGQEDKVLSLHVFFEGDDPILFADRLKQALQNRRYANSLLKYHFFVDSMPEDRSRKIGRESVARISKLAKGMLWDANSEFADKLNGKLETLLQDAQKEYVRVQNLITFEKVRSQGNLTVLPADLVLPPPPEVLPVPLLAVKVLPSWDTSILGAPDPQVPRGFRQAFEWFCKASLVIRPEVCAALQVTRGMCLDLLTEKVFETAFNTPLRLQEFSERQEASIMRLKGRLGMWVNTIRCGLGESSNIFSSLFRPSGISKGKIIRANHPRSKTSTQIVALLRHADNAVLATGRTRKLDIKSSYLESCNCSHGLLAPCSLKATVQGNCEVVSPERDIDWVHPTSLFNIFIMLFLKTSLWNSMNIFYKRERNLFIYNILYIYVSYL